MSYHPRCALGPSIVKATSSRSQMQAGVANVIALNVLLTVHWVPFFSHPPVQLKKLMELNGKPGSVRSITKLRHPDLQVGVRCHAATPIS